MMDDYKLLEETLNQELIGRLFYFISEFSECELPTSTISKYINNAIELSDDDALLRFNDFKDMDNLQRIITSDSIFGNSSIEIMVLTGKIIYLILVFFKKESNSENTLNIVTDAVRLPSSQAILYCKAFKGYRDVLLAMKYQRLELLETDFTKGKEQKV